MSLTGKTPQIILSTAKPTAFVDPALDKFRTQFERSGQRYVGGFHFEDGKIFARRDNINTMIVSGTDVVNGKEFKINVNLPPLYETFQGVSILAKALAEHHAASEKTKRATVSRWDGPVVAKPAAKAAPAAHAN